MELIFYIFITIFIFSLIFNNVVLKIKLTNSMKEFLSVAMDNAILKEKLSKALEVNEIDTNNDSEAFTKFLSQSRDWAFEYIEDAQEKIIKMVSDVEYDIKNFQNFTSSHDQSSNVVLLNKFIKHYDELKKMIPKDPDA